MVKSVSWILKLIEVAIYHKPTSTMRTIASDSYCPLNQKYAALHSMVYRMCKIPLTIANYKKEYDYIKEVADIKGYRKILIDKLIMKHSNKIKRFEQSTLFRQNNSNQVIDIKKNTNVLCSFDHKQNYDYVQRA